MKVSLNTIKQYIDFELPSVEELKKRINEQLGKVEGSIDLGAKYGGAVIVHVVSAEKHPNADKLSVCWVDDGGVVADISRNENGHVQVVCGAPNVHADMFAVWLPPNSTVPASFDDAEPFVLSARELRGVVSQGMLAAADELAVGSDHNGIIELTNADLAPGSHVGHLAPGLNFAETFGLNDTVLEVENKMFTHRPDCFGQLGVAREIAGILRHKFTSPDWYLKEAEFQDVDDLALTVANDAREKVPRFMAVAIKDVTIQPSPFWLQCELVRLGSKSINNVVDITNYVMLLTAQPLHAYDYDKLSGRMLGVRMGRVGEKLPLLNGKTYEITTDDIVIVDGEKPIGMGGIMGGGNSEVSADTKNIVLECATFDMYTIRKTSMRHGLFTDAVTRFNKGQSPLQNPAVLARALEYLQQLAGGKVASTVFDLTNGDMNEWHEQLTQDATMFDQNAVNERLGLRLSDEEIHTLLDNVELTRCTDCIEDDHQSDLHIFIPFWRTDITCMEDIVEEVGRLHGFADLPKVLPTRSLKPVAKNQKRELAKLLRESLSRAGANEVLTYSFVHKNLMEKAGQDVSQAFQLGNALSPDLQYYRLSVLPSLLDKVHGNIKAGYDEFVLFEIGKAHNKKEHANDDDGLPSEIELIDAVYAGKKSKDGAAYYYMRRLVTQLTRDLGFTLKFTPADTTMGYPITAPFDLSRSAMITSRQGEFIGLVGEFKQAVVKGFKLPEYAAGMTLDVKGLLKAHAAAGASYVPLSRFPSVTQDISLKVAAASSYEDVFWTTWKALQNHDVDVRFTPVSIYQSDDPEKKTVTLRIEFTSHVKTLTGADIAPLMELAANAAKEQLGAEVV